MPASHNVNVYDTPGGSSIRVFPKPTAQFKALVAGQREAMSDVQLPGQNPVQQATLKSRQGLRPETARLFAPNVGYKQSSSPVKGGGSLPNPDVQLNSGETRKIAEQFVTEFLGTAKTSAEKHAMKPLVAGLFKAIGKGFGQGIRGKGRASMPAQMAGNAVYGGMAGQGANDIADGWTGYDAGPAAPLLGAAIGAMTPLGRRPFLRNRAKLRKTWGRPIADGVDSGLSTASKWTRQFSRVPWLYGPGAAAIEQMSADPDNRFVPAGVNPLRPYHSAYDNAKITSDRMASQFGFRDMDQVYRFADKVLPYVKAPAQGYNFMHDTYRRFVPPTQL